MKKLITGVLFALSAALIATPGAYAAGPKADLEHVKIDLHDKGSLQRGAKYFINYCMTCHSTKFSRYNRVALDLGLTEEQVVENFIFTRDKGEKTKVGALMTNAIPAADSERWFGVTPPDLSLTARSRGADWIYSFLKGFYQDDSPSRTTGVNNTVLAGTAMPHVLWELQGWQAMEEQDGKKTLSLAQQGSATPEEYDQIVTDITNYLVYVGEPAKLHRSSIGWWVLIFLALFGVLAYMLKKEYWKDVH